MMLVAIIMLCILFRSNSQHHRTNHTHHRDHNGTVAVIPHLLSEEYSFHYKKAHEKLLQAIKVHHKFFNNKTQDYPFEDLLISLPIPKEILLTNTISAGQFDDKYFIGTNTIKQLGKRYVAYGFGTAGQVGFEKYLLNLGASVYAFDCTDVKPAAWKSSITFKPWCLGRPQSFSDNYYTKNIADKNFTFYSLTQIKSMLNHKALDLLKMDIEGFEWDILQSEIIDGDEDSLPEQLLFELHTQGANPRFVPSKIVEGKTRHEVNVLMLGLFQRGYRLMYLNINPGDKYCADLSLLRVRSKHHRVPAGP